MAESMFEPQILRKGLLSFKDIQRYLIFDTRTLPLVF